MLYSFSREKGWTTEKN